MRSMPGRFCPFPLLPLAFCLAALFFQTTLWAADSGWRIRIHNAAVVSSDQVRLGEIAEAEGRVPQDIWKSLANTHIMPAPDERGRPMSVAKSRLQPILKQVLGQYEGLCIYPGNIAVQRGGLVVREAALKQQVMQHLSGALSALPGDVNLQDFRLPPYVFLAHSGQTLQLENSTAEPGRNTLRFSVLDSNNALIRRFTGSVMVNAWAPVFCAARPLNRGETLEPAAITTVRKNLAHVSGDLWDGKGGPWLIVRPVGTEQPIFMLDIAPVPLIRKGNVVTLRYESSSVTLSVKAEAMSDGGAGETIPVKNLQSKRIIHAVVVDGQTVLIKGGM